MTSTGGGGTALKADRDRSATAAGNAEAGPSEAAVDTEAIALDKVRLVRRARTPLFLPSDANTEPSDESYIDEAEEGSKDENMAEDEDEEEADEMDVDQTLRD
jgi:hypothetical protein